jgi:hypothetical protein
MTEAEAILAALKILKRLEEALNDLHSLMPAIKNGGYRYFGQQLEQTIIDYQGYLEGLKN